MKAIVRAVMGPLVLVFLLLAWWFDHRGFLHGMAFMAQVWWLWSIRPRRSANAALTGGEAVPSNGVVGTCKGE